MSNRPFSRPGGGPGRILQHEKVKIGDAKSVLKRLLSYLSPMLTKIIFVLFMSVVATSISIIGTRINGIAVDNYIIAGDASGLLKICIFLVLLYITSSASTYIQMSIMTKISQKTTAEIRKDLFGSIQQLPLKYFDTHSSGEIMSRLTNDVDNINTTLSQSVAHFFSGIVNILGMFVAMLLLSPLLTTVSVLVLPVTIFVTKKIAAFTKKYFKSQQIEIGKLNGYVEEMVSGQKAVILFGREEIVKDEFNQINKRLQKSSMLAQAISGVIGPANNLLNNITYLIIATLGGYLILINSGMTVGIVFTFLLYMRNFTRPVNEIANLFNTMQSALAGAERVFEVMDEEKEKDDENASEIDSVRGNIKASNVFFSYEPGKPVLKNASFDVKQGQTVAIVGPTGAGKTTIISLLTRFYDIDKGVIAIDGREISDIKRQSLRQNIGIVLQDTYLFSDSVMENIRYGRPSAGDDEVISAAKLANADSFINQLDNGYDTILSDNAQDISQGQRQLLAIARAILAKPAILILDEATSSIDTRTELKIQQAMKVLMKGRTNFIIAHRLSTVREADMIFVINNGEIIERGTHNELLDKNGFYANLYNSQFRTGLAI